MTANNETGKPNLDSSFITSISSNAETTGKDETKSNHVLTEYQVYIPLDILDKAIKEHFAEAILTFHSEQGTEVLDRAIQTFFYFNQEQTAKHILVTFKL